MNRRGFTLVELMVVIAIIATLLSLATLAFNRMQRKAQIEREVKELYADLMFIRQQAVVTGMTHRIQFVSERDIVLRRYSSEGDATGTQIQGKNLPYAIRLSNEDITPIAFNSRGIMVNPMPRSICVFSNADPVPDSIVILQSRISMGKIINQGGACAIPNITLQ